MSGIRFTAFSIDGFDYLNDIEQPTLVERSGPSGATFVYELTVRRADDNPDEAWLGGYAVRPEFMLRFEVAGQRALGRWRRTEYTASSAVYVSVGEVSFVDTPDV